MFATRRNVFALALHAIEPLTGIGAWQRAPMRARKAPADRSLPKEGLMRMVPHPGHSAAASLP